MNLDNLTANIDEVRAALELQDNRQSWLDAQLAAWFLDSEPSAREYLRARALRQRESEARADNSIRRALQRVGMPR